MKVLFVAGSPRAASVTRGLVERAVAHAREAHRFLRVDVLDLAAGPLDPFRGFGEEYSEETRDAVARVQEADALLLGSPVFNGSYSSAIKNLFEHVPHKSIEGHVAGFVLVGDGSISFLQVRSHLAALMTYFNVHVVPRAVYAKADDVAAEVPREIARRVDRLVDALVLEAEARVAVRETRARAAVEA